MEERDDSHNRFLPRLGLIEFITADRFRNTRTIGIPFKNDVKLAFFEYQCTETDSLNFEIPYPYH